VQTVSQFNINPGPTHLTAVKCIYCYLASTLNLGITYKSASDSDIEIHTNYSEPRVFADADWANSLNDRKSISGYVSILAGGATMWSSKKQATVALSTMEAEYVALTHAAHENLWLRSLFTELDLPSTQPTPIFVDNCGTIDFTLATLRCSH
jgi:hypothetical protein